MQQWVKGKVIEQKQWAQGLFSLFVEAPIAPFVAGQFTQLALDEQHKGFRSYSFANAPHEPVLEFYYSLVTQGRLTPQLVHLAPQDPIWIAPKAVGQFILSRVPQSQTLWLLATGTGLGVFLSLLKTDEPWTKFEKIVLVHSVRYGSSLTHQLLIKQWQQRYPERFHWVPVITREPQVLFSERLPQLLESGKLESTLSLPLTATSSQVMLCGNPAMIDTVSLILQKRGLTINRSHQPGHITLESYWR